MTTATATTSAASSSSLPSSSTASSSHPPGVLTLVMTVEYNGFRYAGFQRQTPTPRNHGVEVASSSNDGGNGDERRKRKKPGDDMIIISSGKKHNCKNNNNKNNKNNNKNKNNDNNKNTCNGNDNTESNRNSNKRAKAPTTSPQTVQDEIEKALQQWTNLSIATLRVRGAGRTDKGVHASGQVVAFDIPLRCLFCGVNESGEITSTGKEDVADSSKHFIDDNTNNDQEFDEKIPSGALTLLRNAYNQKVMKSSDSIAEASVHREYKQNKRDCDVKDQWEIRRAITTRLARDIVIRSIWIWNGNHPFEPREGIVSKTYDYHLRFRCLSYIGNDSEMNGQDQQQSQMNLGCKRGNEDEKRTIHPICHAGPCLLRRVNDQNAVWLSSWPLDPALLRSACQSFVGKHDFRNFVHKRERHKMIREMEKDEPLSPTSTTTTTTTKTTTIAHNPFEIHLFEFTPYFQLEGMEGWSTDDVLVVAANSTSCSFSHSSSTPPIINVKFQLRAKGFKRSMVRMLVGFVVDVARGSTNLGDIPKLLMKEGNEKDVNVGVIRDSGGNRIGIVNTAPACGLFLAKVEYGHNHFI